MTVYFTSLLQLSGRATLCVAAIICLGCATTPKQDSMLAYSSTAEAQYHEALGEFEDKDCITAEKLFMDVRKDFPYSRFATLAEVRLADCQFIQGTYAEAAVSHGQFVKTHPTHEETHWAAFRQGQSYYEMMPSDLFFLPPPEEKDLSTARDARTVLSRFIAVYTDSAHQSEAKKLLGKVEDVLVEHHMYVANFYLKRDDMRAAALRLENIKNAYPAATKVPDAMFLQATIYLKMDKLDDATKTFKQITSQYPEHYQARRAEDYLQHLDEKRHAQGGPHG